MPRWNDTIYHKNNYPPFLKHSNSRCMYTGFLYSNRKGIRIRWTGATGMDYWNGPLEWTTGAVAAFTLSFCAWSITTCYYAIQLAGENSASFLLARWSTAEQSVFADPIVIDDCSKSPVKILQGGSKYR